jgi:hypothetical protein
MALQLSNPKKPEHMRAFNPDRDMIWALPRLMRQIFHQMGELSDDKLRQMLDARLIGSEVYGYPHANAMGETAKEVARMFNLMQQFPEKAEEHAKEYQRMWKDHEFCMPLIACLLMDAIFAELPMWFDQVRPMSKLAPQPNVEEIEKAANEFLDRIHQG